MDEERLRTPWEMKKCDRRKGLYSVYDCDGNVIAPAKVKEIAQLIVAAPDMLEAIESMLATLDSTTDK